MDTTFALPVATHVARREAGLAVSRGRLALDACNALQERLDDVLLERFGSGRKLDGQRLDAVATEVRAFIAAHAPLAAREVVRPATRTRPKGESYEFLSAYAFGAHDGVGDVRSLLSLRVSLTRRKAIIDRDFLGLTVTRHALERAIERDVATWTGGLREVDETLYGHMGLVVLWRWAMISGRVPRGIETHLPMGDGLILGRLRVYGAGGCCARHVIDVEGSGDIASSPNGFHVAVHEGSPRAFYEYVGHTILNEDHLRLEQVDYRDAVRCLCERHASLIQRLGVAATWREMGGVPILSFEDVEAEMDTAADGIRAIVEHPWLGSVVRSRPDAPPFPA